jgi:hypothetical protein
MSKPPVLASVGLLLLRINALLWLAFGILTASGAHPGIPDTPFIRWGMASLAIGGALLLLTLDHFLRKHSRVAYVGTLALLSFIAISLLADQFGLADLAVLILTAAPILLLAKEHDWYLQPPAPVAGGRRAA